MTTDDATRPPAIGRARRRDDVVTPAQALPLMTEMPQQRAKALADMYLSLRETIKLWAIEEACRPHLPPAAMAEVRRLLVQINEQREAIAEWFRMLHDLEAGYGIRIEHSEGAAVITYRGRCCSIPPGRVAELLQFYLGLDPDTPMPTEIAHEQLYGHLPGHRRQSALNDDHPKLLAALRDGGMPEPAEACGRGRGILMFRTVALSLPDAPSIPDTDVASNKIGSRELDAGEM